MCPFSLTSSIFHLRCGIPKVMLEGEKEDWEDILHHLEHLKKDGVQTIAWYHLLRPVISRFVSAYDDLTSAKNLDFWNKVSHFSGSGSGPPCLSGWITAFCIFNDEGQWQCNKFDGNTKNVKDPLHLSPFQFASAYLCPAPKPYLTLDNFPYPHIDNHKVSCGYTHVNVKLIENGTEFDTMFIVGSISTHISMEKAEFFLRVQGTLCNQCLDGGISSNQAAGTTRVGRVTGRIHEGISWNVTYVVGRTSCTCIPSLC